VIVDAHDRVFLARKPGASAFMQPGVKVMPRDSAVEALQREIAEELDLVVAASPRS
jgi:8-oxo-dGTP pyrophosphatase MutT (NUDIX family)